MKRKSLLLMLSIVLLAAGAWTKEMAERQEKGMCKADAMALCKDVKPGGGNIRNCLVQNVGQIKDESCKAKVENDIALETAVKQACQAEIGANCKGMEVGTGLLKCLGKNRKTLSDGCKTALRQGHKGRRGGRGGQKGPSGQDGSQQDGASQ